MTIKALVEELQVIMAEHGHDLEIIDVRWLGKDRGWELVADRAYPPKRLKVVLR